MLRVERTALRKAQEKIEREKAKRKAARKAAKERAAKKALKYVEKREEIEEYQKRKAEAKAAEKAYRDSLPKEKIVKNYSPKPDSWPEKVLIYLEEKGESRAADIRREIGLDEYCKGTPYDDRSNYTLLSNIIPRLISKGLVKRTSRGYYALTHPFLKEWDELSVQGKDVIVLTFIDNLGSVKNPIYGALVSYKGQLGFIRYKNGGFELLLDSETMEKYYEEDYLIKVAIKYELTFKYVK